MAYNQRGYPGNRLSRGMYEETTPYPRYEDEDGDGDGCAQCLKYLIIIFNIVFLLAGIGVCAGSIFILVDNTFISDVVGNDLLTISCWLVIIGSGIVIFISICGCCGAIKSNQMMLFVYAGILCTVALVLVAGGVMALALKGQIGEWVIAEMEETLKEDYAVDLHLKYNQVITQAWDRGQDYMFCCAVRDQSWGVYRRSRWYADQPGIETVDKPYVPRSCCKKDLYGNYLEVKKCQTFYQGPPGVQSGIYNEAVHYRGCYTAGEEWIDYYSSWLAGLGIGLGVVMALGIFSSIWLAVRLRKRRP